ncbi:MAG: YbaB/EbfC family nucleoid-associated protein [Patescibacteria group bacterium]|nr:YbaB/EbfC family nucleoid-associated protein [Patescibacteria group bacterium]
MFDKVKDLYQLKKQASALQKELANTIIEATSPDDLIKVEVSADMKIRLISIDPSYLVESRREQLEFQLKNVMSSAMTQAQQVAANKMKEMGGLEGLMGGLGM